MHWVAPGKESAVRTTILGNTSAAKRVAQCCAPDTDATIGAWVCTWWRDGAPSDNGHVGTKMVCKHGIQYRTHNRYLSTGHNDVFDSELSAIRLSLNVMTKKSEPCQRDDVKSVAAFNVPPTRIGGTSPIEPSPRE